MAISLWLTNKRRTIHQITWDLSQMRNVHREYFTDGYPARMTATTDFIEPECLIQLDVVAYKG